MSLDPYQTAIPQARTDLEVNVALHGSSLQVTLIYSSELFDRPKIEQFAASFCSSLATRPGRVGSECR